MRFFGKVAPHLKQPNLHGYSMDPRGKHLSKCHDFLSVSEVKSDFDKMEAEFTLVAGKYVSCKIDQGTMCGPASSFKNKTIIYPCNKGSHQKKISA